jgi:hypothetical protein
LTAQVFFAEWNYVAFSWVTSRVEIVCKFRPKGPTAARSGIAVVDEPRLRAWPAVTNVSTPQIIRGDAGTGAIRPHGLDPKPAEQMGKGKRNGAPGYR